LLTCDPAQGSLNFLGWPLPIDLFELAPLQQSINEGDPRQHVVRLSNPTKAEALCKPANVIVRLVDCQLYLVDKRRVGTHQVSSQLD
jgi:hypothetical protein